ncbi:MAG: TIGR00269 family protein [Candidatus Odinarchaeota archaeon]|nr:TIGR00269 family protein [Candidatus Odinarchaeota archaeon]
MKCKFCSQPAFVRLKYANLSLCETHFTTYFENRVKKTIEKYKLINEGDMVVAAVSGGKDSMALLHTLRKIIDNEIVAFHIDLGIGEYSKESRKIVEENCKKLNVELKVCDLKKEYGFSIGELSWFRKKICSTCGTVKRYLTNKFAYEVGADVIATGHNLDDEIAFLMNNFSNGNYSQMYKMGPKSESIPEYKLVGRVKPLYEITDKESLLYCISSRIKFIDRECPYATRTTVMDWKLALSDMENKHPGIKLRILRNFLREMKPIISKHYSSLKEGELKRCEVCGMPTSRSLCTFCALLRRINMRRENNVSEAYKG